MSLTGTVHPVGYTQSSSTPTPPEDFYAVLYVTQNLSPAQKAQAIANIGALTKDDIENLLADVNFDSTTGFLSFTRDDGNIITFDLSANEGINDIDFDINNDLQITFFNRHSKILNLSSL